MDIIKRLNDSELYIDAVDDAITEIERLRKNNTKLLATCKATYAMFEHANAQHLSTYHEVIMDSLKSAIADAEGDE
jgi:hypothetical protein